MGIGLCRPVERSETGRERAKRSEPWASGSAARSNEVSLSVAWLDLDGAVNVRDLGGLPTDDGRTIRPHRLIRADNLQDLSARDIALLVDEFGVRSVADLRTDVEVASEGPGPLAGNPAVEIVQLSLFPESGTNTDAAADDDGEAAR